MSITSVLAELAANTSASAIAESAYAAARKLLLDSLGCAIAGWDSGGVEESVAQMSAWGGAPEAEILVYGLRVPAPNAAFADGVMIHALDYDDTYTLAALHLMSSILPVSLAAGESVEASGRDVLTALILGVEVAARLGLSERGNWGQGQGWGFLPSTIIGGFGTTAACSRLLGLSAAQATHAMGIYYMQNSGSRQALEEKTLGKRLQPAFTARSALWSACLAARGVTGPCYAVEGSAGLEKTYLKGSGTADAELVAQGAGQWEVERLSIKQFTSCGACHALTQAALDLAREEDLDPGDIERVEIYLGEGGSRMVGLPFEMGENPQVTAQFSAAYGAAVALLRRRAGLDEFTDERVRSDHEVAELARRIVVLTHMDDPPAPSPPRDEPPAYADRPHVLTVRTRSGRSLRRTCTIRRVLSPEVMDWDAVVGKFRGCTAFSGICDNVQTDAIIQAVCELEEADSLASLLRCCRLATTTSGSSSPS